MIRVSCGSIKIGKVISDRWGQPRHHWSANGWAYIDEDLYKKIRYFEEPLKNETDVEYITETIKEKLRLLNAYNVIYQFNAEKKKGEYYRMCAVMNNPGDLRIQEVSRFDAYVKYPIYSGICTVANIIITKAYKYVF